MGKVLYDRTSLGWKALACLLAVVLVVGFIPIAPARAYAEEAPTLAAGAATSLTQQPQDPATGTNADSGTGTGKDAEPADSNDATGNAPTADSHALTPMDDAATLFEVDGAGTYATTLAEALEYVSNGGTIKLLGDVTNATGVKVPSGTNFTLDFGGHTYTLAGPGAGSKGTETNGFQLLKGSTITFKNGTLNYASDATEVKRMIQNYANLTLEDMKIYAEHQVGGEACVCSFNNGEVVLKGSTAIVTTSAETVAFDVYDWPGEDGKAYPDGARVTIENGVKINGVILFDSDGKRAAGDVTSSLTITGGEIGGVQASSAAQAAAAANIEISGGTFTVKPDDAYLAEGLVSSDEVPYTVREGSYVAKVGSVGYLDFAKAAAAAIAGNDVVELLQDTVVGYEFPAGTASEAVLRVKAGSHTHGAITATDDASLVKTDGPGAEGVTVYTVAECVAKIGSKKFGSLEDAVAAANAGTADTIELVRNVELTKTVSVNGTSGFALAIGKSLTIDGGADKHTITCKSAWRGVGIHGDSDNIDVAFKNLSIINKAGNARCIDTRGNVNSLTLAGVDLDTSFANGNTQPLTIGGNQSDKASISISDTTITAINAGYPIITFNPVDMTIKNSTLNGYCSLYIRGASSSAGSGGSSIEIDDSTLNVPNPFTLTSGSSFSCITFEKDGSNTGTTVTLKNSKIHVETTNTAYNVLVDDRPARSTTPSIPSNTVVFDDGNEIWLTGDNAYMGYDGATLKFDEESLNSIAFHIDGKNRQEKIADINHFLSATKAQWALDEGDGSAKYVLGPRTVVAKVGAEEFLTLYDALQYFPDDYDFEEEADPIEIEVVSDVSHEDVVIDHPVKITGGSSERPVLNDVTIESAVGYHEVYDSETDSYNGCSTTPSLELKNLAFTGASYVNVGAMESFSMDACSASVDPPRVGDNGRSAFIVLGPAENKDDDYEDGIGFRVTNSTISCETYDADFSAVYGPATVARLLDSYGLKSGLDMFNGNTFGSVEHPLTAPAVELLSVKEGLGIRFESNTVYGDASSAPFSAFVIHQPPASDSANPSTFELSGNTFTVSGQKDAYALEVAPTSGSDVPVFVIDRETRSTMNGDSLTIAQIKNGAETTATESFCGVGVDYSVMFAPDVKMVSAGTFDKNIDSGWYNTDLVLLPEGDYYTLTKVSEFSVSPAAVSLILSEENSKTAQLASTLSTDPAVSSAITWASSNSSVATVDENGLVTAVASGTATITASVGDLSASCEVTVYADAVAQTGGVKYGSLAEAFAAAAAGATVELLTNASVPTIIQVKKNVTLDLMGHTVSGAPRALFYVRDGATFTVRDSSEDKTGTIRQDAETICAVYVDPGSSFVLESGRIEAPSSTGVYLRGADPTFSMTGGSITSNELYGIQAGTGSAVTISGDAQVSGTYGVVSVNSQTNVSGGTVTGTTIGLLQQGGTLMQTGGTITTAGNYGVYLNGATFDMSGGSVTSAVKDGDAIYAAASKSNTVEISGTAEVTSENGFGVAVFDNDVFKMSGGSIKAHYFCVTNNGSDEADSTMEISGGTLTSDTTAIYHPGPGTLTISGGELEGKNAVVEIRAGELNVTGGTLTATADHYTCDANGSGTTTVGAAIAVSQHTTKKDITVNISGTPAIEGYYALSVSNPQNIPPDAGKLEVNITGGTFDGKGEDSAVMKYDDERVGVEITGGSYSSDVSQYVPDEYKDPKQDGRWVVVPGSYVAKIGYAGYDSFADAVTAAKAQAEDDPVIRLLLNAGDYTFAEEGVYKVQLDGHDLNATAGEGLFLTTSTETVDDKEITTYTVRRIVAKIGEKVYGSLAEAIEAVGNDGTITMVADVPDAKGITVASGKNFTVDFDGHTYTLAGPGAGSKGTETNGFQLLKDSTITFKNGTLNYAADVQGVYRMIQNYANLTLENMTINAKDQCGGEGYVCSFNNGSVLLTGETEIVTTSAETVAFDVYDWPGATGKAYPDGARVTIQDKVKINGVILFDSDGKRAAGDVMSSLTITGGEIGGVRASSTAAEAAKSKVQVNGGVYVQKPASEYVKEGFAVARRTSDEKYVLAEIDSVVVVPERLEIGLGSGATPKLEVVVALVDGEGLEAPQVTWSSRDDAVATVTAEGVVTACGEGSTNIVAEVAKGEKGKCLVPVAVVSASAVASYAGTGYPTLVAAVEAAIAAAGEASPAPVITVLKDTSPENVTVTKSIAIESAAGLAKKPVLADTSITVQGSGSGADSQEGISLSISGLEFTGTSYISAGEASKLEVIDCEASGAPAGLVNSHPTFIVLDNAQGSGMELVLERNVVKYTPASGVSGDAVYGAAVAGNAPVTSACICGNTFGARGARYKHQAVNFTLADDAQVQVSDNVVWGDSQSAAFTAFYLGSANEAEEAEVLSWGNAFNVLTPSTTTTTPPQVLAFNVGDGSQTAAVFLDLKDASVEGAASGSGSGTEADTSSHLGGASLALADVKVPAAGYAGVSVKRDLANEGEAGDGGDAESESLFGATLLSGKFNIAPAGSRISEKSVLVAVPGSADSDAWQALSQVTQIAVNPPALNFDLGPDGPTTGELTATVVCDPPLPAGVSAPVTWTVEPAGIVTVTPQEGSEADDEGAAGSSSSSEASVAKATVNAVSDGSATITASSAVESITCQVFVKAAPIPPTPFTPPEPALYTATFANWDGTVLSSEKVEAGNVPAYSGKTPMRDTDAYAYGFLTWDPQPSKLYEDTTYTAVYEIVNANWSALSVGLLATFDGTPKALSVAGTYPGDVVSYEFKGVEYRYTVGEEDAPMPFKLPSDGGTVPVKVERGDFSIEVDAAVAITAPPVGYQMMYRVYNPNSGEHFYTANWSEVQGVVAAGWNYEQEEWTAPLSGAPVYRLYSGTDHHYTKDESERDWLISLGWRDEGIGWYSADEDGVPLYRLYNPNVDPSAPTGNAGSHHYTSNFEEVAYLEEAGWTPEGIGWYGAKLS